MKDEPETDHGHPADAGVGPRWLDDSANVKKMIRAFLVLCGVLLLAGALLQFFGKHDESGRQGIFAAEGWFIFYPLYGFISYVTLVFIAKGLRKILMRGEDYYDH